MLKSAKFNIKALHVVLYYIYYYYIYYSYSNFNCIKFLFWLLSLNFKLLKLEIINDNEEAQHFTTVSYF